MLFNSFSFLLFFPLVSSLYFGLKSQRNRLWLLLLASAFFYGFFILKYLLILILVIGVDYFAALQIEGAQSLRRKKLYLVLSLITNISILGFFKYANFFIFNLNQISSLFQTPFSIQTLNIILPIGLSFHTFQSLSYVFEVYYGRYRAERDLLTYSIYVLYFPQLVAGPIERPQNVLPQLKIFQSFEYERTVSGLYLVAQGLFKKAVLADTLSPLVNLVYANPGAFGSFPTVAAIVAFSFQIYCDFSGYSDIARGVSRVLGIELMLNFNQPYFATSMGDFWRRWHRSLSTWFRDYLYIPLGGSRGSWLLSQRNLLIVFVVSGFWHGASWSFIAWGGLHGLFLIGENAIERFHLKIKFPVLVKRLIVFILVTLAWVFFRAKDFSEAAQILKNLSAPFLKGFELVPAFRYNEAALCILGLLIFESFDHTKPFWESVRKLHGLNRWAFYWAAFFLFLITAQFSGEQFIYFQF